MIRILPALVLAALSAFSNCAPAQSFPSRPVRLMVGGSPGGGIDLVARLLATPLQEQLGQPVVVDNRAGASGAIGAEQVRAAAPDGHSLLVGFSGQMVMAPVMQPGQSWDPVRDFEPVARVGLFPVLLVVNSSLPAQSVPELVRHAKANPGKLTAATGSSGFFYVTEAFKHMTGIDLRDVPFTGSAASVAAVTAGTVDLSFVDIPPAIGQVRAARLRALGVSTAQRVASLPEVPAIAESVPGFEFTLWIGLFAPAGTPKAVVDRLHHEIAHAVAAPELREKMLAAGVVPVPGTPKEMGEMLRRDLALVRRLTPAAAAK